MNVTGEKWTRIFFDIKCNNKTLGKQSGEKYAILMRESVALCLVEMLRFIGILNILIVENIIHFDGLGIRTRRDINIVQS